MKLTAIFLLTSMFSFAENAPTTQHRYTKALIDMVNAKFDDDKIEAEYKKAKAASNDRQVAAGNAINQALQAKVKECQAEKRELDTDKLDKTGEMACTKEK